MVMKQIVIPKRYLKAAKQKGTRAIQGRDGRMQGRKTMKSGKGDSTKVVYLNRNLDLNENGRIEDFERKGTIHGRTEKVLADSNKRGTIRRF